MSVIEIVCGVVLMFVAVAIIYLDRKSTRLNSSHRL